MGTRRLVERTYTIWEEVDTCRGCGTTEPSGATYQLDRPGPAAPGGADYVARQYCVPAEGWLELRAEPGREAEELGMPRVGRFCSECIPKIKISTPTPGGEQAVGGLQAIYLLARVVNYFGMRGNTDAGGLATEIRDFLRPKARLVAKHGEMGLHPACPSCGSEDCVEGRFLPMLCPKAPE